MPVMARHVGPNLPVDLAMEHIDSSRRGSYTGLLPGPGHLILGILLNILLGAVSSRVTGDRNVSPFRVLTGGLVVSLSTDCGKKS